MTNLPPVQELSEALLRPIIGIENRTAQEVFDIMSDRISRRLTDQHSRAAEAVAPEGDDTDRMWKISKLIAELQDTHAKFGDTCVYIRRGGLSWGAVALNRQSDDKKHGVFDLQATHDRAMAERMGQVQRLIEDRNSWRRVAEKLETEKQAASPASPSATGVRVKDVPDVKLAIVDFLENRDGDMGVISTDEERSASAIKLHDAIQPVRQDRADWRDLDAIAAHVPAIRAGYARGTDAQVMSFVIAEVAKHFAAAPASARSVEWFRDLAKDVMLAATVDEASRMLSHALVGQP